MSKNYQSGDVWSRAVTVNGFAVDELRSVLQKSIRRGLVEEAALAAHELFTNGAETEEMLWRRLEIIATEDVGLGMIMAPAIIESLYAQATRMLDRDDRWIYCAHAVRLLATSDELTSDQSHTARSVIRDPFGVVVSDVSGEFLADGSDARTEWLNGLMLLTVIRFEAAIDGTYMFEHAVDASHKEIPLHIVQGQPPA